MLRRGGGRRRSVGHDTQEAVGRSSLPSGVAKLYE